MIRSRTVRASNGGAWTIERHWAERPAWWRDFRDRRHERRTRPKGERSRWWEWLDPFSGFDIDNPIAALMLIVVVAVVIVFLIYLGAPLFIFLIDTLLILPLLVVTVIARVLFRRPWTIEASTDSFMGAPRSVRWRIAGWAASSRAAARMAGAIQATGDVPAEPPADLVPPQAHRRRA